MRVRGIFLLALIAATLPALAADPVYYPKGAKGSVSEFAWKLKEKWYRKNLKTMKEPSIYEQRSDKKVEVFRFLWLRSFDKPIAIRIEKSKLKAKLRVVRLSGAGGYDPGRLEYDKTIAITSEQWGRFLKLLAKASFWDTPTDERPDPQGLDGSQWILEGLTKGKYHVVLIDGRPTTMKKKEHASWMPL